MKFKNILLLLFVMGFAASCTTPSTNENSEVILPASKTSDSKKKVTDGSQKSEDLNSQSKVDSAKIKRFRAARTEPPTEEQKVIGNKICDCMTSVKLYDEIVKAKSQEEFNEIAGENAYDDVLFIQSCHSKFMKPAVKGMELEDAGIFALKSRAFLEKKCMDSNPQLWFYIGKYITAHRPKGHNHNH